MPKPLFLVIPALLLWMLAATPTQAQTYRVNAPLGELFAKKTFISMPNNPGGKNILENSCIYKDTFSLSPNETLLDQCNVGEAISQFTTKYGRPDQTSQAPGGRTVLEYFLEYKENQYHVKLFVGCTSGKTDAFAMVECTREKNRVMPGGPPGKHSPRGGMHP